MPVEMIPNVSFLQWKNLEEVFSLVSLLCYSCTLFITSSGSTLNSKKILLIFILCILNAIKEEKQTSYSKVNLLMKKQKKKTISQF